jgi:hypothetical protein
MFFRPLAILTALTSAALSAETRRQDVVFQF